MSLQYLKDILADVRMDARMLGRTDVHMKAEVLTVPYGRP